MPVKQNQVKNSAGNFYTRGTARWPWLLAIMLTFIGLALNLPPALATLTPGTVVVDDKISVSFSGLRLNRSSNTFDTLATLTNQSTVPIDIPVQLAITTISSSTVTLANATGVQSNGAPYVNVPISDGILDPGESVSNILLKFNNPQKTAFTFKHSVFGVLPKANHPPIANAGGDQTVPLGTEVTLNGINSTDEDGDSLTYRWQLVSQPANSTARLDNPAAITPKLVIDLKGTYQIELLVNDGQVDSQPALVVITTENSKPVAAAGDDQTVFVQQTAHLDGVNSKDIDGDTITFKWRIIAKPAESKTTLQNETTQTPGLTPDKPGDYTVELIVNDGLLDSDPDRVIISTQNSKPIANAGPDQLSIVGNPVTLDGQLSHDVDDDPLSFVWSVLNKPANSNPVLQNGNQAIATLIPDLPGDYISQLIVNDSHVNSEPDTALVTVSVAPHDNHPPQITTSPVLTATVGESYSYDVNAGDSDNDTLTYSLSVLPTGMTINAQTGLIGWTPREGQTGPQAVTVNVIDGKGGSDSQSFTVAAAGQITVPDLHNLSRAAAETVIKQAQLNQGTLTFQHDTQADGSVINQTPTAGASVSKGATVNLTVSLGPDLALPPNPATVASRIDPTVATTAFAATEFLYKGGNPIQTGMAETTIEAKRAAVIRGKVMDKDNKPLAGVRITVLNHPEFGQTLSRTDGQFDMAVNGGGYLTVNYRKDGYLPVQRQVNTPWQDYTFAEDAILIQQDTKVTTVDLTDTSQPFQVAQGSPVTDEDGTRQATLLIPQGTHAQVYNPDGTTRSVSSLTLRLTEYTVGANGPKSMPAALPPESAYTYAFEMKAEEGDVKINGKDVLFDRPVPVYIDNFLKFPVGMIVPVGYYNRDKAAWIPSDNGKVIKILTITDGKADIDSNGDNAADDAATLSALGVTDEERAKLAELYLAGKTLWRVQVSHLSTWDCNLPFNAPSNAIAPNNQLTGSDPKLDDPCESGGSIIECETQVLRESIAITGTNVTLNYASDLQPGRKAAYTVEIPISGAALPNTLTRIDLEIRVAGRLFKYSRSPTPNQKFIFTWDGRDGYGRRVLGQLKAVIRIGYAYGAVYATPAAVQLAFGKFPSGDGVGLAVNRVTNEILIWQEGTLLLNNPDSLTQELGGWTLAPHHVYGLVEKTLYQGSGERRSADSLSHIIMNYAGNGQHDFSGDGGPAIRASLTFPQGIAIGPDGSLYIADSGYNFVRRVGPDGVITTVAGNGGYGFGGDGGPATQASVANPGGLAVGPDDSLYIAETGNNRIRRVGLDGIITTVAGNGQNGFSGDGGPATQARLYLAYGYRADAYIPGGWVAVGRDGSLYIADVWNYRIRRVGPDGIITTVAGNGQSGFSGDGGPAVKAGIGSPCGVAVGSDGSLYIADAWNNRIRRVGPDGIITTIAGNGQSGYSGDGGPAIQARLGSPRGVTVGPEGSLYIAEAYNYRIRRVGPDGIITTVAGNGTYGDSGDGGPATQASLSMRSQYRSVGIGVAVDPDRGLYIADYGNERIRLVAPPLPGFRYDDIAFASKDGSQFYQFVGTGKHLRTLNALTGMVLQQFGYDNAGLLTSITDADGNVVTIERDALGNPKAIVAPFGQRTELALDANGYLASVKNPDGGSHHMTYTNDGLLLSFADPNGHTSAMTYDALGRLIKDEDAAGGSQTLARTELTNGYEVTRATGLNRTTTYRVEDLATGDRQRRVTAPDGTVSATLEKTDGTIQTTLADGTVTTLLQGPDPRFGMQSPLPKSLTMASGGKTATLTKTSTALLADASNPLSLTQLTNTTTLNGRTFASVFDSASKTSTSTSAAGRLSSAVIDDKGRLLQYQRTGIFPGNLSYDAGGRLVGITQGASPDERSFALSYNLLGNLNTLTDALGRTANFVYNDAGRVTRQILPDGREILYDYDANGNLTSLTPPGRPAHVFHYTPVNLSGEYVPPDVGAGSNSTLYDYDLDKKLTRITRPDGAMLDFSYDSAGRLKTLALPNTRTLGYTYNATGKLSNISAPDNVALSYTYNGALLTETIWDGQVTGRVGRSYDNDFRVASLNVNGVNAIAYQYDADSLLIKAGDLTLNRSAQNSLLTGTTLGTLPNAVQDSYAYDGFGEVTAYEAKYGTSSLLRFEYDYDKLGRITQKRQIQGGITHAFNYGYDTAGRLVEVKRDGVITSSYGYDANGNRTHLNGVEAAHYDDQDRLLDYQGATYQYTANGELKQKTVGGQTTQYGYDLLGNLRQVTFPGGTVIDYLIDGQNRRIGKKRNGALEQAFLYQGQLAPIAELDGSGAVVSRFVYATGINVPDTMIKGGVTYRIVKDHLGSPRLVVDVATDTVAQEMDYDVFGNVTLDTNPGFQPFGFAGGLYDRDTRLVRFGARDYDAETGRWTAKDPILFGGKDTNLYGYVMSSPTNFIDPSGNTFIWEFIVGLLTDLFTDTAQGKTPDPLINVVEGSVSVPGVGSAGDAVGIALDPNYARDVMNGDLSAFNPNLPENLRGLSNRNRAALEAADHCN